MKRHKLQHFVDIKMDKTLANPEYHLIGEGVDDMSEEMNAETETTQWINQANGTTDVKSYTPSISVSMQDVDQEDADLIGWINNLVDTLPTGSNALTSYIRVRIKGEGPTYPAVQLKCAVTIESTGGAAGENVTNSFTLGGVGDLIQGTFNAETKKFTATTASGASLEKSLSD